MTKKKTSYLHLTFPACSIKCSIVVGAPNVARTHTSIIQEAYSNVEKKNSPLPTRNPFEEYSIVYTYSSNWGPAPIHPHFFL